MSNAEQLTLLFIHGAGGTKSKWRSVQERLIHVNAEYIDLPGRGNVGKGPEESIEKYAEWLNRSIRKDAVLVGHSMGGLIAIELAARNQHAKGLVLVASHYRLPVHPGILAKLSEGTFPESLFYASYSKRVGQDLLAEEKTEISLVPMETTLLDYECCNRYSRGQEMLSRLEIPILVLYGGDDRLLPPTATEEVQAANPRVCTRVIPDSGHYIMLEKPDEFVNALSHFLNNNFKNF